MNFVLAGSTGVAFEIGDYPIYWYGIIITCAILLDFILFYIFCKKSGNGTDMPYDIILCVVPLAIVCARLFSVLFEEGSSISEFFYFRSGGMSIIGAVIGGALGILLYCIIKKKNFLFVSDMIAPLLILGQSIGRWGNYINQEVYGQQVLDASKQWFPYAVEVGGKWYQALFFYESMLDLLGFVLLVTMFFTLKGKKGFVTGTYLVFYGTIRFFLEGLRDDEFVLKIGNQPVSKIISLIMAVIGLGIIIYSIILVYKKKKSGKEKTHV